MDKNTLKNYLKRALELEKNKLELERLIPQIDRKYEPEIVTVNEGEIKARHEKNDGKSFGLGCAGAIVGFFLGAIIGGPNFLILAGLAAVGGYCGYGIGLRGIDEKINSELSEKKAAVEKQNAEIRAIANKKNKMISSSVTKVRDTLAATQSEIDSLYANNFIHPKYRNLVAITSMYEYIDTGRCNSLEGPDGAYNIFEMEVRLDRIITKMDAIINNLEQIRANQFYLYEAINDIRPQLNNVTNAIIENTNKLNEVAVNTAVTAYTTQVIERNQYYGRNWNDGRGIYNDRLNMPKI